MIPKTIQGGNFADQRGEVAFVNDFSFADIKRFYTICNSAEKPLRAWQGHKLDQKNFYCTAGSFRIFYVKIDNWENPSKNLEVQSCVLSSSESKILVIPPGFANAILAIEQDSKLISFCTLALDEVALDDVRFEANTWSTNG